MSVGKKEPPLVAIVGRPNVGKSTLFNRLVGSRRALVDDIPGVTRDRNYGTVDWRGMVWRLVDTGGFEPAGEDILGAMRVQTEFAVNEADAVVFLLDGKSGLVPADREVAVYLLRQQKPVIFAVNKIDVPGRDDQIYEFYELGAEKIISLSAEHGYGVDDILDVLVDLAPGVPLDEFEEEEEEGMIRVAVVGKPNVGKSTLINSLLGEDRHLVHDQPGTTRDAVDSLVRIQDREIIFIDTAGMRRKAKIDDRLERFSVMRSIDRLERCDVAVLMIDAVEGVTDQDAKLAGLAHDRGRGLVLAFNKWDLIEDKEARRAELEEQVSMRLPHVNYAPILTISAIDKVRLQKLANTILAVIDEYNKRISTGELNRALEEWQTRTPPPSPQGKALKIYYATQAKTRPPVFTMFANRPSKIPDAYRRYLINQIRENFGFVGSPVKLSFRARKGRAEKN